MFSDFIEWKTVELIYAILVLPVQTHLLVLSANKNIKYTPIICEKRQMVFVSGVFVCSKRLFKTTTHGRTPTIFNSPCYFSAFPDAKAQKTLICNSAHNSEPRNGFINFLCALRGRRHLNLLSPISDWPPVLKHSFTSDCNFVPLGTIFTPANYRAADETISSAFVRFGFFIKVHLLFANSNHSHVRNHHQPAHHPHAYSITGKREIFIPFQTQINPRWKKFLFWQLDDNKTATASEGT